MRDRISKHEKAIAARTLNASGNASQRTGGQLKAMFDGAQRTHGNRLINRYLQTLVTHTACSCGKSTGAADACEECGSATWTASRSAGVSGAPSITTIETGDDTETIERPSHRSISIDGDGNGHETFTVNGGSPCSVSGSFSSIPFGPVAASLNGTKLGATFAMEGKFVPSIPCTCGCGEYRQYIRGKFTKNGSVVTHALCGSNLHPTNFQEDCGIFGGTSYRYGYRSQQFATSKFTPDQAGGCKFEGQDTPGITGSSGDVLSVNLDFQGKLIDTCNGNAVLASSAWNVSGTATVP